MFCNQLFPRITSVSVAFCQGKNTFEFLDKRVNIRLIRGIRFSYSFFHIEKRRFRLFRLTISYRKRLAKLPSQSFNPQNFHSSICFGLLYGTTEVSSSVHYVCETVGHLLRHSGQVMSTKLYLLNRSMLVFRCCYLSYRDSKRGILLCWDFMPKRLKFISRESWM